MLTAFVLALALQTAPAEGSSVAASPAVSSQTAVRAAHAQATIALVPGTAYDPAIPTLAQVVGHDFGQEITSPADIVRYLGALAHAAPTRTKLVEYGRTWEGRPLHLMAIGSPERLARLEAVKADLRRLADPRGLAPAEADRLVADLPVVVWLVHAVHGNEISSSDAALAEAYHLLAARGDAKVDAILREAIVLIDPLQNPDGRTRFLTHTLLGRAAVPDAEPWAVEHDEPWPGGRSNHYLFDMNRDWFAQTQLETRGRIKVFLEWYPHVVVDLHEMGGDSSYYFAPPAQPYNPFITKAQAGWFETFGRANAQRFDERGFPYFVRETFDSFYPGYGESWPLFHGAVGMTFEQASSRGLAWRREDGTILTFGQGVLQHFTAALSTAHTSAANRERLLRDFLDYRRSAMAEGERGTRAYLIPAGRDAGAARRLATLVAQQGLEVVRATAAFRAGDREFPAGTFIASTAQPGARMLRNLLDPHVAQPEAFLKEQDRRRRERRPDQIYDVTAWSLPLLYDVEVVEAAAPVTVSAEPVAAWSEPAGGAAAPPARVAYLLPWGNAVPSLAAEALHSGMKLRHTVEPFTLGGRRFEAGTLIVRVAEHDEGLAARLGPLAARHGVELVATDSSYTEDGTSFGSNAVVALKAPRVLLAWDTPASSLSAGWTRYTLERRFGQPVTAVRVSTLPRVDLHRYDVVVLPAGNYPGLQGEPIRRLKDWVSAGGTLVTLGEASRWASRENVGLLETRTELRDGRLDIEAAEKEPRKNEPQRVIELEKALQPERERPESTPGAILRVMLDREHWLSSGTDGEVQAVVEGNRVFRPLAFDKGRNVGLYAPREKLVASGLVWNEARDQLANKAYLLYQPLGRGHIVAFAEDPNFRAFSETTSMLFMNAVLLGPAY
jgi:hypothetical protein